MECTEQVGKVTSVLPCCERSLSEHSLPGNCTALMQVLLSLTALAA